ncbi:MAG: hypothetical protein HUJ61_06055 [Bacilli bacterium]|nr:hypothetical protein [Bacilli bacterium]
MIQLDRRKDHKWIFQKNISSADLMTEFLKATKKYGDIAQRDLILAEMKRKGVYKGRSAMGSANTMGVRTSEMKFYMFGYSLTPTLEKPKNSFFLSAAGAEIMHNIGSADKVSSASLVNLFSIQFPHPFSKTSSCFNINAGRLIIKLLIDSRLGNKLYVDEFCYFIPFLESVDLQIYEQLVASILEFRKLNYYQKYKLFHQIPNYDDVFSNTFHEFNYYFFRIYEGLGVFDLIEDKNHNDGKLFSFNHGNCGTKRNDAIFSRGKYSGYVILKNDLVEKASKLINTFDAFEKPIKQSDDDILSKDDFILQLYQTNQMKYMSTIDETKVESAKVAECINNMVHASKYGSRDGKEFEKSLKPVFELFRQIDNVEIISGSGDTDLLCAVREIDDSHYKINVDAKTSHSSTSALNPMRLTQHLKTHGSRYCIVVSSRFATGVSNDILNFNIVAINAEALANYCFNAFNISPDGFIDFSVINDLVQTHMGTNITQVINSYCDAWFGLTA